MTEAACASPSCRDDPAFDRVQVSYLLRGGAKISWTLRDAFTHPGPLLFQLQVGRTANPDADDWEDVGAPVEDAYWAIDGEQRVWSNHRDTHYRVVLTAGDATYISAPIDGMGTLNRRDWLLAREVLRQELLRLRRQAGQLGLLLKRRVTGEKCPVCLDPQTGDVLDPNCPTCWGTGLLCGYFYPMGCIWADVAPGEIKLKQDPQEGTVSPRLFQAQMLNTVDMAPEDLWVNLKTDDRYYIRQVKHTKEIRGVPLVSTVLLQQAPVSDVIYSLELPQQLEAM